MWPPVLDMTRDECRGVLRRLELETYANVVSTFRAQGGLNDTKSKLLEELRNVFHISTDRHRAEARRVANDEQLCTIAETISGPNTTQEWSREGRRSFPLLSRSAPYTALSAVANGVAEVAKNENAKLPYPSETTRISKPKGAEAVQDIKQIVKQDPSLLSADEKRNLKRQANQITDIAAPSSPTTKKRTISGSGDNAQQTQPQLQTHTKIQQLYHNHSKTQSRHKKGGMPKRTLSGSMKNTAKAPGAVHQTPVKTHPAPKTPKASESPTMPVNKNNLPIPRNLHTYASMPQSSVHYDTFTGTEKSGKLIVEPSEAKVASNWPQIATSKKDITNNLSKLNMMTNSQIHTSPGPIIGESGKIETVVPPSGFTSDGRPAANNAISSNPMTWASKSQSAVSTTIVPRPVKTSNSNISGPKANNNNNNNNNKQLPQSQHQPSPNSSAISMPSGYININQKAIKPENASIVTLNERKEIELANAGVVAATTFVRQDSIPGPDGGGNSKAVPFIGSGNFDLKTNTEGNPSPVVGSTSLGTKPKIQIHSNQTISPGYGSLKLSPGVPLKCLTGGRKTVQLYSSPSGKMFIQSAEGSKSQLGATPGSATATTTPNRYALQKVQIVTSSSANPIKPISFNKSEMILMPGSVLSTAPNSGNVVVRSIPVMKQNKRLPTQILSKPALNELSSSSHALVKNQNVIVIGAVPTEKSVKDTGSKSMNEASSMITEDTPVDILTTPITSMDSPIQVTAPSISKDGAPKYELKSPITMLQTITSPSSDDANKRIIIQEEPSTRLSGSQKSQQQKTKAEITSTALESRDEVNTENSYIVSSTDWEVELDQQAANTNRQSRAVIIQDPPQEQIQSDDVSSAVLHADNEEEKEDNETSQQIIDNFHDVIEEDTIYEESIMNDTTEGEDDVEFDVSYGSVQEDMEDGVAIEYVEDAGASSDVMIEEYGEIVRSDTDENDRSHTVKMLPVSQAQTIIYSTSNIDSGARGKIVQSSESSSSSSVIFEIDENGFNQINR